MKDSASSKAQDLGHEEKATNLHKIPMSLPRLSRDAANDASGSSPYREGTGPAMMSPSKRAASAGQELRSMTGMLSLKQYKDSS